MNWTLFRYYLQRWLLPLAGGLFFFGGLMVAWELRNAAREITAIPGASYRWILPLLATTLPEVLATVLPMAAVLGGLLGTQHLSEGSEMVASQGLGAGAKSLFAPWSTIALLILILASLNAHFLVPATMGFRERLRTRMVDDGLLRALKPGQKPFYPAPNPGMALWLAPDGALHQIEVSERSVHHLVASSFRFWQDNLSNKTIYLSMFNIRGSMLQRSDDGVRQVRMNEQTLKIVLPATSTLLKATPLRFQPTSTLLSTPSKDGWVELSRRVCLPLATAALLLLGIGLGICHPRFHKGGALVRSLSVIITYYILLKYLENQFLGNRLDHPIWLFLLPLAFLGAGVYLVYQRLRPHHVNRLGNAANELLSKALKRNWLRRIWLSLRVVRRRRRSHPHHKTTPVSATRGVLRAWSNRAFLRNWAGTMAAFLTLDLLIEFATLAGDLSTNKVSVLVFLEYWCWNLPPFLAIVLPMAFLLAGTLTFSDASVTHEWIALRAGGSSLVRWIRAGALSWLAVLALSFVIQAGLAPLASNRADPLWDRIKARQRPPSSDSIAWLHSGSTQTLWRLEPGLRWGFSLRAPGDAPVLRRWRMDLPSTESLAWGEFTLTPGPTPETLFPARQLRLLDRPEGVATWDLVHWLKWAPDAERSSLLWNRLLGWLAGPALLFAAISYAFPAPRMGRGQAVGYSLILGLVFTGAQMIFGDAARTGELPAVWGVLIPLLFCIGFGLIRLPRLRT